MRRGGWGVGGPSETSRGEWREGVNSGGGGERRRGTKGGRNK